MPSTKYFVKGQKDGQLRRVQHLPIDADTKETLARRKVGSKTDEYGRTVPVLAIQPNHYVMLLGDPATAVRQVIAKSRIITVVDKAAGLPH